MNDDFLKVIHSNFDNLKKTLEQEKNPKNYIQIIDYLINFLGCLTLSSLKSKITEISKDRNISKLTAGEWVNSIEGWVTKFSSERGLRELPFIKEEFINSEDGTIRNEIKRWISLRNILCHDRILINNSALERLIKIYLYDIKNSLDKFIDSLTKFADKYPHVLKSDFFYYDRDSFFIYSGIENDSKIKYRHFSIEPQLISKSDFILPYREVFLSLSQTPINYLFGKDEIIVEMKTLRSRSYENDFQLWINKKLIKEVAHSYRDGDHILFSLTGFDFEDCKDVLCEVKALRNGKIQATDEKLIRIYSKIPEVRIEWEGIETKNVAIDKVCSLTIAIQSEFEITDVKLVLTNDENAFEIFNTTPNITIINNRYYRSSFNVLSTNIQESVLKVNVSYDNRDREQKVIVQDLKLNFTPNFFEPDFAGDSRKSLLQQMSLKKINYLIVGEGGIGESRLISEFMKINSFKAHEINIMSGISLITQLADNLKISFNKNDKIDLIREKIITWFQDKPHLNNGVIFWFKDCHEITNDDDRQFLKTIVNICNSSKNNLILILESRDATWSVNAKRFIEVMKEVNIDLIELDRLDSEGLNEVIDSIFKPNKFFNEFKQLLIKKSDGIVYLLIEFLKHLYNKGLFKLEESNIWSIKSGLVFEEILEDIDFHNVLKINVDECLNILDSKNLGDKSRDILRYLCIERVNLNILKNLSALDIHSFQYILDILQDRYVIKNQDDYLEYHHQLKRDYCAGKYFPANLWGDYFVELGMMMKKEGIKGEMFRYMDTFFDGIYLKDEFTNLSNPHLEDKIQFLLDESMISENVIDVMSTYNKYLSSEKIIEYAEEALFLFDELYDLNDLGTFDYMKEEIELILKEKNIDELDPKYLLLKGTLEYKALLYSLWYKNHDLNIEPNSLRSLLLFLTDKLIADIDLSKGINERLDIIHLYYDLASADQNDIIDIYSSIIHINGLLALLLPTEEMKFMNKYREYLNKLFLFPITDENSDVSYFFVAHSLTIKSNGIDKENKILSFLKECDDSIRERIIHAFEKTIASKELPSD